ncbi:MAG: glycoside hydrolase family 16 protein [Rubrivivax sp.]|nr:glycoside hydrolase family 16 protein [Rubrivivax sp.]
MNAARFALAAWLAAIVTPACAQAPLQDTVTRTAVPAGYRLVWADEFDRDGLPDPARWTHDTVRNKDGWYNNERQYYSAPRAENAVVKNGRLVITARKESLRSAPDWGGQPYTSARLITRGKADWTYGFFEVRARMPCGKGTWPAIWTLGSGGRWPDDGELDILEHMGREPDRVSSAVHVAAGHGGRSTGGAQRLPTACSAFHDYQMHWTPDGVSFGVDGFVHAHYPRMDAGARVWPFDKPQFMVLNVAIGGDLGGPVDDTIFPVAMEIEHVRVYQRAPEPRR